MNRPPAGRRLGVVGYSARALAEAARDLGFEVIAVDAFGDQDTLDVAQCRIVRRWPQDLVASARDVQCHGWLLAGGMENYGRWVSQLAAQAPVLGPAREQLAALRSLKFWRALCEGVPGLRMPATFPAPIGRAGPQLLYKPRRSCGGVHVIQASAAVDTSQLPRGYWQEIIDGRVLGVTSLISDSQVHLLGATESLAAEQWPGPQPYVYRGSIGPVQLEPRQRQAVLALTARVGERLDYRGYLQADLIEDARGELWLLELNPRWTAGMEVLHACTGEPAGSPLAAHLAAFHIPIAADAQTCAQTPGALAKAILYAPCDMQLSFEQRCRLQEFRQRQAWDPSAWWNIADVPPRGADGPLSISAGQPILTLRVGLTTSDSPWAQVRQTLLGGLKLARNDVIERAIGLP